MRILSRTDRSNSCVKTGLRLFRWQVTACGRSAGRSRSANLLRHSCSPGMDRRCAACVFVVAAVRPLAVRKPQAALVGQANWSSGSVRNDATAAAGPFVFERRCPAETSAQGCCAQPPERRLRQWPPVRLLRMPATRATPGLGLRTATVPWQRRFSAPRSFEAKEGGRPERGSAFLEKPRGRRAKLPKHAKRARARRKLEREEARRRQAKAADDGTRRRDQARQPQAKLCTPPPLPLGENAKEALRRPSFLRRMNSCALVLALAKKAAAEQERLRPMKRQRGCRPAAEKREGPARQAKEDACRPGPNREKQEAGLAQASRRPRRRPERSGGLPRGAGCWGGDAPIAACRTCLKRPVRQTGSPPNRRPTAVLVHGNCGALHASRCPTASRRANASRRQPRELHARRHLIFNPGPVPGLAPPTFAFQPCSRTMATAITYREVRFNSVVVEKESAITMPPAAFG